MNKVAAVVSDPQKPKSDSQKPNLGSLGILPGLNYGVVAKLACKCSHHDDADFVVKKDGIVCTSCGKEIQCKPPILGVFRATCSCCISNSTKTTFILDSAGTYICSWCGLSR